MRLPAVEHKTVLITGCSTGIGRATARLLRDHGWRVLATARQLKDVDSLASEGFESFPLDLADDRSVAEGAKTALNRTNGRIGALVNNAGYGQPGALEDVSREALRRQFEVNVFGLQDLTNRILPAMIKAGAGRIVHVSSVLGRLAIPLMGAYCATKHAVEALADAQRIELRNTGVGVILIEPGPIETAFHRNARTAAESMLPGSPRFDLERYALLVEADRRFAMKPESVAKAILKALESRCPRRRYTITVPAKIGPLLRTMLPGAWWDALLEYRIRNLRK
ncbi:MAG: SDR family NAD(P)-dependent oxidoreductase [Kiritimatiellae bacterium]|nr:SDR family NAD(P)-dependent oxidoreductase [Kiritimatiellia bacterium]MDW8458255.1 SDR family NAD(P)-dependent oxidoreductase [Verrucomicrobiota bacterium]